MNLYKILEKKTKKKDYKRNITIPADFEKPEYKLNKPQAKGKGLATWRKYCKFTLFAIDKFWYHIQQYNDLSCFWISTHDQELNDWWNEYHFKPLGTKQYKQVKRLIDFMVSIGLIKILDPTYIKNRTCKTYAISKKNVELFIEDMRKESGIMDSKKVEKGTYINKKVYSSSCLPLGSFCQDIPISHDIEQLKSKIKLSTNLHTKVDSEKQVREVIEFVYPQVKELIHMVKGLLFSYYDNNDIVAFAPHVSITPHIKNGILKKCGCRAFTFIGNQEKEIRQITLDKFNLTKHYDITSSIPRITYSINHNYTWLDEDIDIYEAIKSKIPLSQTSDDPEYNDRDIIKQLFLRCYFESSEGSLIQHSQRKAEYCLTSTDEKFLSQLFTAVRETIGEPLNNEVFLHESYIMTQLTGYLLEQGWLTLNVYDSVYCDCPLPQKEFVKLCRRKIKEYFESYCRRYLI